MAALDILQEVTGAPTVTFSSVNAGELLLFTYMTRYGYSNVSTTAGLTRLATRGDEWPMLQVYARVAQAGDPTSWTFTPDGGGQSELRGYRIEGPFTDLTGITADMDASFTSLTSRRVRLSDMSVGANTLVIAALALDVGASDPSSVTNSFTSLATVGIDRKLSTARRLYTSSATDVSTTFTWTTAVNGNSALIRIPAPSGASAATLARYRKLCKLTK